MTTPLVSYLNNFGRRNYRAHQEARHIARLRIRRYAGKLTEIATIRVFTRCANAEKPLLLAGSAVSLFNAEASPRPSGFKSTITKRKWRRRGNATSRVGESSNKTALMA